MILGAFATMLNYPPKSNAFLLKLMKTTIINEFQRK